MARPLDGREILLWAGSIAGYAFAIVAWLTVEAGGGGGLLRMGPDLAAYLRAGSDLLGGAPVYVGQIGERTNFPYAPPWAVVAAGLTFFPPLLVQVALIVLDLLAIRYVAGSWRGVGWVLLWPLTVFVISAGNIDLLIGASIVLAWSRPVSPGQAAPLTLMAFAKLAPALALPPARWREVALTALLCLAVTLPVLGLWPEWLAYLVRQPASIAISLPLPPWYWRLPVALALAALGSFILRRPWVSALAVVVAMPSLYLSTSVILIAPLRLWLDERRRMGRGLPERSA